MSKTPPPKTVEQKNPYASLRNAYADFSNPLGNAYAALKSPKNENAYASIRGANSGYQYFAVGSLRGAYAELPCLTETPSVSRFSGTQGTQETHR